MPQKFWIRAMIFGVIRLDLWRKSENIKISVFYSFQIEIMVDCENFLYSNIAKIMAKNLYMWILMITGLYKKFFLDILKIGFSGKIRKKIICQRFLIASFWIQAGNSKYECYLSYALVHFWFHLRICASYRHKGQKPRFPP